MVTPDLFTGGKVANAWS